MRRERIHRILVIAFLVGLLLFGIVARIASFLSEPLDFDTYALFVSIDLPYSEYLTGGGFAWSLHTHYWWTAELLGVHLWAFRLVPALISLLVFFLVLWLVRQVRPRDYVAPLFATFFIAVNAHAIKLVGYPMISYSVDFLFGGLLVGLLAYLIQRRGEAQSVLAISILMVPLALFASIMIVVPIVAMSLAYVIWRQFNSEEDSKTPGYRFISSLRRLWPLLMPIAVVLLIYTVQSFDNLGSDKRPDMDGFFLQRSGRAGSVAGFAEWSIVSTVRLIGGLVLPVASEQFRWLGLLLGGIFALVLLVFVLLGVTAKHRHEFWGALALFIFLSFLAVFVGGILGLYPFGTIRYWGFMVLPAAIAVGLVFGELFTTAQPLKMWWLKVGLTIAMTLSAVVLVFSFAIQTLNAGEANKAAIRSLDETADALIVYSNYSSPALIAYQPWVEDAGLSMGWGTFFGQGSDGGPLSPNIMNFQSRLDSSNEQKITVVAPSRELFEDSYPTWTAFLGTDFELVEEIKAPDIWIGRYR